MIHLTQLFGWMTPGELRHFPFSERDDAVAWGCRRLTPVVIGFPCTFNRWPAP